MLGYESQRVMPSCIFILSRFTLRVDNVLFRTFDTRIYHSLKSSPPLIVRDCSGWEAPYDVVKQVRVYENVIVEALTKRNGSVYPRRMTSPL